MKKLLLLRHAKSSWDDPALADFDRPLAPRGLEAAPLIGREMARRGWIPQKALVSPALRTRDTWRLAAAEWPVRPEAEFAHSLYEASAQDILAEIRATAKAVTALLIVGHNPGLEELAPATRRQPVGCQTVGSSGQEVPDRSARPLRDRWRLAELVDRDGATDAFRATQGSELRPRTMPWQSWRTGASSSGFAWPCRSR